MNRYLLQKQEKYQKYTKKNAIKYKCVWTISNQKRQELMKNWRGRNVSIYDDLRPIYEPLDLENKETIKILSQKINDQQELSVQAFLKKLLYRFYESGIFTKFSKRRYEIVSNVLLLRTVIYTSSIEFTNVMNIPTDFHIEHAILNMHVWLMVDRLNQIDTPVSRFMAKQLLVELNKNQAQSISRIHLKKKNDFILDISHYMKSNRNAFQNHVYLNPQTNKGNSIYYKLDALIWSTVFFEKIPRYSNEVYMMAEYFKQHFDYLRTCTLKDFEDGLIEFDCYRIETDFVRKVQKYSPRLSEQEFNEEFHSDNPNKKYYYSYKENPTDQDKKIQSVTPNNTTEHINNSFSELPINTEKGLNSTSYKNIRGIDESVNKTLFKFQTLHTYDYMNDLEKLNKEDKKKIKKYAFKQSSEQKAENEVDELDPEQIKKIRYQRNKEQNVLQSYNDERRA